MEFAIGLTILVAGLIWFAIRMAKGGGYKEAQLENSKAENETIKENIKATTIKENELASASDSERAKLRNKWTRKP